MLNRRPPRGACSSAALSRLSDVEWQMEFFAEIVEWLDSSYDRSLRNEF